MYFFYLHFDIDVFGPQLGYKKRYYTGTQINYDLFGIFFC